jgi:hypothetical protein
MAQYDIIIKSVAAQQVASVRKVVPTVQEMVNFSFAMGDVLATNQVHLTGPWLHVYHHDDYRKYNLDVETVVPVDNEASVANLALPDGAPIRLVELPAVETMVATIHQVELDNAGPGVCRDWELDRAERLPNWGPLSRNLLTGRW